MDEVSLNEVIISGVAGSAGVEWPEEVTVATATVAGSSGDQDQGEMEGSGGGEVEEVMVFSEGGRRIRVDRYMPSGSQQSAVPQPSTPPPPQSTTPGSGVVDIRAGGSELAGFFHPILFVPH